MRSQNRGGPPALPPEEAAVTYSRIEDAEELPPLDSDPIEVEGRREPTFTAMRVDPPQSRHEGRRENRRARRTTRVDLDDFDDRPIALDPEAIGAVSPRRPRRRRSRALGLVLLVGALAVLGGVGVLGATVLKVLYGAPPVTASAPASEAPASQATDATAIPVNTPTSVLPDSGSAGPGILALPANDGGPIDMTPAAPAEQPQAALEPVPPAPAPQPEARPASAPKATATTEAPPLPKPAPAATVAAAPSTDADINNALSDVDRLLAEKKAQAGAQPQNLSGAQPQQLNGAPAPTALAPLPQAPNDQSAALNITPQPATEPPPLPAPTTVADPSIPVPPADIPNPSN